MRTTIHCMLLALAGASHAQPWTQLSDFPGTARDDGSAFAIGTDVYVGTGMEVGWGLTQDWYRFNTLDESWQSIAALPAAPRQYCTAFSISGTGFLFGGTDGPSLLNELWAYDPLTDAWSARAPLPAAGRSGAVAFVLGGKAYVATGRTAFTPTLTDELWCYDPGTDTWSARATMPGTLRHLAAAFALDGSGHVVTGQNAFGTALSDGQRYDPVLDAWSSMAPFPQVRYGADAFGLSDRALLIGGYDSEGVVMHYAGHYMAALNAWVAAPEFSGAQRKGGSGAVVDDAVYFGTGITFDQRHRDWWRAARPVGLPTINTDEHFRLWPQPVRDEANLDVPADVHITNASVFDALGRPALHLQRTTLAGPFDLSSLPAGAYVLRIEHTTGTTAVRFIRQE